MGKCYMIPSFLCLFRLAEDTPMAFFRYRRVDELPSTVQPHDENSIIEIHQGDILYLAAHGVPKKESVSPANAEQTSEGIPAPFGEAPLPEGDKQSPEEGTELPKAASPYPEGSVVNYYEITFLLDDCAANSSDDCKHFDWFHGAPGAPVEENMPS